MPLPRGKVLGGSTSINAMAYVRGHPADFDQWGQGWSYNEVLPYFKKSENAQPPPHPYAKLDPLSHGQGGLYPTSFREPPMLPGVQKFIDAAVAKGYSHEDYNSDARATCEKGVASVHQFTILNGKRSSTYTSFLKPFSQRANLTIKTGALATRIVLKNKQVVGVEYTSSEGPSIAQANKEVIVSCGSYQTPELLLRSGIGPQEELKLAGIECVHDSPHVGKHLKDHLMVMLPFLAKDSFTREQMQRELQDIREYERTGKGLAATSIYEASVFLKSGVNKETQYSQDGQITWTPFGQSESWCRKHGHDTERMGWDRTNVFSSNLSYGGLLVQLAKTLSEGQVTLNPGNGKLVIQHNYLGDERDLRAMIAVCKEAVAIKNLIPDTGPIFFPKHIVEQHGEDINNDEVWADWIRHYSGTVYHPTSTCAIGKVVSQECVVTGLKGLRIADASVMPDIVAGNTMAASVMIGEKVADLIATAYGIRLNQ